MVWPYRDPFVLYEVEIQSLLVRFASGSELDVTPTLSNGRANYILFQHLVAHFSGLTPNSEGGASDLVDESGLGYEVKAYKDPQLYPSSRQDLFQTSASSTFPANNLGPRLRLLLQQADYEGALAICRASGYDKNAYYVYTNTGGYRPPLPFRYLIVPTSDVLKALSTDDPRLISRRVVLGMLRGSLKLSTTT